MQWDDDAIVLGKRAHGETHVVATLFTRDHGAASGLVHGGQGRTKGSILQQGNGVRAAWKARTDEALGHFALELLNPRAAHAVSDRDSLLALTSVCELLTAVLPEGNPYPPLFAATEALLDHLGEADVMAILMVKWEIGLLASLGFSLTLDRCVATGRHLQDGPVLTYVSPKSGGAVSAEAGEPYRDKLLPLPPFIIDAGEPTWPDVAAGLRLTGYFLESQLLAPANRSLPDARDHWVSRLERRT